MIRVFEIKDLIKYFTRVIFPIIIAIVIIKLLNVVNKDNDYNKQKSNILLYFIDENIKIINETNSENDESLNNKENIKINLSKYVIASEFQIINNLKDNTNSNLNMDNMDNINQNEDKNINTSDENQENKVAEVEQAKTDVQTEVINSGVNPRSTNDYNGVKINNATNYALTEEMLNPEGIQINNKKVIIYHTHTCESYTPTDQYNYQASGTFRSINLNFSVARVGDELTNQLTSYGCTVIHDKTYHDYPAYNGSYSRSLKTAQNDLKDNTDADIVIDLHRDAIADSTYAPKVKIGNEYVSQLMFVMGSNVANSINKNWNQNLKFAIRVQQKSNELYPGLFKPIILRNSEYNQHVAKAACIIEVGATGNTLEESIRAMKYLAKIISEL